jgi:hypothetical protein
MSIVLSLESCVGHLSAHAARFAFDRLFGHSWFFWSPHAEFTDSHERVSGHMMLESAALVMRRERCSAA